jgi:uncharacterized coiled-coil DUF342 family protein
MAETYGFFDSENHDRPYTSAQMSQYFQGIVTNGVFDGIGKNLVPYISGPYVKIPSGRAVVDWHWYNNDDTVALNFPITSGSVRCILVLACDYIQRKIYPQIKQGTSVNLPDVTDTENIKYLKLAYLQVSASTATITKICIGDETPLLKNLTEFVVKEDGKSLSTNDFTDEYKSQIDTNTSGIDELKSRADAVDVNVSDLSDKVKQNTADTEQLKSKTDATDEVVGHLSKSLQNAVFKSNVDTELNASSENPVQNKAVTVRVEGIDAQVTQLQSKVSDNIADIKTNSDNISALDNKAVSAETEINSLKSKTDATNDVVAHLSESLQNAVFKSSIDTELSTTSENPVQNKVVSANINSLTASVNYMSEHKADTTTVNGVISDVSKLNSRVTANETAINSNTSNINAVDARVDSLFDADTQFNKDIASVNATATIAKTKAETNQTDIAANKSEIALNKTTLGYQKKNLCPVNSKTMSANGWVMGGGGTDVYKVYIPKGKYILTFKQTAIGQSEVQFFNSTNTQITRVLPYASTENSSLKFTITLSEDCYGMKFYNNSGVNTYSNIMIRDAAITDTTFEPYVESVDERLNTNETEITKLILNKQETEFKLNNVIISVGVNQAEIETLSENLNKFTSQSQLYSNTTDGSSPLTVTVSNLFAEYSAVICNVVTSSGKYSLTLPLRYIKSLGTSAYYEAEGLLFYYVDDSTITIRTGLAQSNPTINSIEIIKLY